jgi:hypothetical protein
MDSKLLYLRGLNSKLRLRTAWSEGDAFCASAPLLKVTADEPHLHLEADTVLLLLGAGHYMISLGSKLMISAAPLSSSSGHAIRDFDVVSKEQMRPSCVAAAAGPALAGPASAEDEEEAGVGSVEELIVEVDCKSVELSFCFAASEHVSLQVWALQ